MYNIIYKELKNEIIYSHHDSDGNQAYVIIDYYSKPSIGVKRLVIKS